MRVNVQEAFLRQSRKPYGCVEMFLWLPSFPLAAYLRFFFYFMLEEWRTGARDVFIVLHIIFKSHDPLLTFIPVSLEIEAAKPCQWLPQHQPWWLCGSSLARRDRSPVKVKISTSEWLYVWLAGL